MFYCDIALSLLLREKYKVIPANNKMTALSESRKFLRHGLIVAWELGETLKKCTGVNGSLHLYV